MILSFIRALTIIMRITTTTTITSTTKDYVCMCEGMRGVSSLLARIFMPI